jgi:hypothetical protein
MTFTAPMNGLDQHWRPTLREREKGRGRKREREREDNISGPHTELEKKGKTQSDQNN